MLGGMDQDKRPAPRFDADFWFDGPPYQPGMSQEPELLGEYSLEEAAEMGAFFDEPAEQEAFEQALAEERAAKASAA